MNSRIKPSNLSKIRRQAAVAGLKSRWGERRSPSRTIRVDEDVFLELLSSVTERERRSFVSQAIRSALSSAAK